jgi:hypothetical protein
MTAFATYVDGLAATARAASAAELQHQKQAAARAAELRAAREFAWRRLNLMRGVAAAVGGAEDEAAATAAGRAAMLRLVGWNGATQAQRDVADRFAPVVAAVWAATRENPEADAAAALADFEAWFAAERSAPFLGLMEREIAELPLVEV